MPEHRIRCATPGCPNTIQPATARRNNGFCGPCIAKLPADSQMPQVLAYSSQPSTPHPAANRAIYISAGIVLAVTLLANAFLVQRAAADRSWIALGILGIYGPATNAAICVLSLILIPFIRRISTGASIFVYALTAILAPLAAILVDTLCILSMGLHGC